MTPLEQLALELPTTRGAHPAWVSSLWMGREVPAWLGDPAMIGALVRLPYCGDGEQSEAQLRARTRRLLQARGDRGWGALCATLDDAAATWLAVGEDSHPIHMRQWPEQTVRAMTMIMQLQGESAWFVDVVNAFETLWCHDARHRLTQAQVDYLMRLVGPRRMSEWYKSLRMLRMYGTVRAD